MPDRRLSLFLRLCLQGRGRLSKSKRRQFKELTDEECAQLERIVTAEIVHLKPWKRNSAWGKGPARAEFRQRQWFPKVTPRQVEAPRAGPHRGDSPSRERRSVSEVLARVVFACLTRSNDRFDRNGGHQLGEIGFVTGSRDQWKQRSNLSLKNSISYDDISMPYEGQKKRANIQTPTGRKPYGHRSKHLMAVKCAFVFYLSFCRS